ncbi:endopygalactorunase [Caudoviricetes sp.]|nr:endopygalactorunase [Caudoviricetes sp.]
MPALVEATVVVYPQIPGQGLSTVYSMTVNGTTVPVTYYDSYSNAGVDGPPRKTAIAWFAYDGSPSVVVTVSQTVSTYTLAPAAKAPTSTPSGVTISWTMGAQRKLILHHVNSLNEDLLIFGDALESGQPTCCSSTVQSVVATYGADPTGAASAVSAFQSGVNAINALGGGGVLYVPTGTYKIDATVNLKSHVHLYLEPGATLNLASGSFTTVTAFLALDVTNLKISGRGYIQGNGASSLGYTWIMHTKDDINTILQDFMFFNGRTTPLRFAGPTNATIRNVKILARPPTLSDGIDLESFQTVLVDDCFVYSTDDSHAIGAGANPWAVARSSDNLTIKDSLYYGVNIFSVNPIVGVDHIKNILVKNVDFSDVRLVFAIYPMGGTNVEDVTLCHMTVGNIGIRPFTVEIVDCTSWGSQNCGAPMGVMGHMTNLRIDHVTVGSYGTEQSRFHDFLSASNSYMDGAVFNHVTIAGTPVTNATTANLSIIGDVTNVSYTDGPLVAACAAAGSHYGRGAKGLGLF